MALNIRKVTAQRAENNQNYKRQFLYYFNRNCLFHYLDTLCPGLFFIYKIFNIIKIKIMLKCSMDFYRRQEC